LSARPRVDIYAHQWRHMRKMVAKSPAAILRKLQDRTWCPQDDAIAARGISQAFPSRRGLEIVVDEVSVAQPWTPE
jgi:hypothetical protein